MNTLNLEQFTAWFSGTTVSPYAVTISNKEQLNVNHKLLEKLPMSFEVGVSQDGRKLCIREKEAGFRNLKSGYVKDKALVQYILAQGVHIPARYTVTEHNGIWLAELDEQKQPAINMTKPPRRPKTNGLESVVRELEGL